MKVFEIADGYWYAGNTPDEATAAYLADVGDEAREEVKEYGPAREITNLELTVCDVDEPGQPKHTLREILGGIKKPGFVATTEY